MSVVGVPRRADVVVVGGGLTGSSAAAELARQGLDVVLLEQLGPSHAGDPADRARVAALQDAAVAHGAVIAHHRRVTAVLPDGDGVRVTQAAGGDVRARTVVVAAGTRGSAALGAAPAVTPPLPLSATA